MTRRILLHLATDFAFAWPTATAVVALVRALLPGLALPVQTFFMVLILVPVMLYGMAPLARRIVDRIAG